MRKPILAKRKLKFIGEVLLLTLMCGTVFYVTAILGILLGAE
jgi:hypothetical protein